MEYWSIGVLKKRNLSFIPYAITPILRNYNRIKRLLGNSLLSRVYSYLLVKPYTKDPLAGLQTDILDPKWPLGI